MTCCRGLFSFVAFLLLLAVWERPAQGQEGLPTRATLPIGIGSPRSVAAVGSLGAATDGFRLELPPGRRGVAPALALLYNSLGSEAAVGVGWQLETGSIQRSAKRGIPAFDGSEAFTFSFAGTKTDLVEVAPGEFRAEKETTFRQYQRVDEHWEVRDSRGNLYLFGSLPQNRIGDDVWMLERVEDLNGNYVTFEHVEDSGELYVVAIDYTGHTGTGTAPANHVSFAYEPRPDVRSSFIHGNRQVAGLRPSQIVVTHASQPVRTFDLNYEQSASTGRTRLESIDVSGSEGGVIRARSLAYSEVAPGWTGGSASGTLPLDLLAEDGRDTGVRPVDIDGDARVDLLDNAQSVWLGDGAGGFTQDAGWTSAVASLGLSLVDGEGRNVGTQLSDVNGDGRPDIISAPLTGSRSVYLNDGRGWVRSSSYSDSLANLHEAARTQRRFLADPCNEPEDPDPDPALPACDEEVEIQVDFSIVQRDGDSAGAFFADVNGDGLVDILWSIQTTELLAEFETAGGGNIGRTPVFIQAVFLNDGGGWTKSPDLSTELSRLPPFVVDSQFQGFDALDVNGDGLADILNTSADATRAVYLNTTATWTEDASYTASLQASSLVSLSGNRAQGLAVTDFNGDGLIDLLRADESTTIALRNTGTEFVEAEDVEQALSDLNVQFADEEGTPTGHALLDVSADGRPDLLFSKGGQTSSIRFAELGRADLLVAQQTALGESTSLSYELSSAFDHRDAQGIEQFPIILPFVTLIARNDGAGAFYSQAYDYQGAVFQDRAYKGITRSTLFDSEGLQEVTTLSLEDELAGRPVLVETFDGSGQLRRREDIGYSLAEPVLGVLQINVSESTRTTFDAGAAAVSERVRRQYDEYLNLIDIFKDGDLSTAADDVHEHYAFVNDLDIGFVSEIARAQVFGASGQLLSDARHFYDGLPEGQVARGNLTSIVESIDESGAEAVRNISYDEFGNPIVAADGLGREAEFEYDPTFTYRVAVTDPLGRTKRTEKDGATGLVTAETDASGATTRRAYDEFGRLLRETLPGDELSPFGTRSVEYSALGAGQSYTVRATETAGTNQTFDTRVLYGGFGWVTRIETEGSGGQIVIVDQAFDAAGELNRRTVPYFAGQTPVALTTARDVLGRITRRDFGDVSTELTQYLGGERVETDRRGNVTRRQVDVFDQTLQVTRSVGGQSLVTSYEYDAFGHRTRVVDAGGNVTALAYDRLGRRSQMTDPARGTIDYEFDAAGQLLSERDGLGLIAKYTYNAAGELVRKRLGTGEVFSFEYGAGGSLGAGRVIRATDPAGKVSVDYDARGNALERRRWTGGKTYTTRFEYDSLHRVRQLRYPDGFEVSYEYGPSTQTVAIKDRHGRPVVRSIEYTAAGLVSSIEYGNDVSSAYAYDAVGKLLRAEATDSAGDAFQSDRYRYDAGGNVLQIANLVDPRLSQSFAYDELNRLTQAESSERSSYGVEEYEYDAIGNLTKKGDLSYFFDGANPYQPTCVADQERDRFTTPAARHTPHDPCSAGWGGARGERVPGSAGHRNQVYALHWDARGNLARNNDESFRYDSEARLLSVSSHGRVTERNSYNAAGQRVLREADGIETVFIDELYETDLSETRRLIPLGIGGRLAASVTTQGRASLLAASDWTNRFQPEHWRGLGLLGSAGTLAWALGAVLTRRGRISARILLHLAAEQARANLRYLKLQPGRVAVALAAMLALLVQDVHVARAAVPDRGHQDAAEYTFYHQDHLGSTKALTNSRGRVVERQEYAPFGETLLRPHADAPPLEPSYVGMDRERAPGAELYHSRTRYYDAVLGRFTTPDSVVPSDTPEALNRYAFSLNNPVRFADPTGRGFWDVVLGVVVVVALVAATIVTLGAAGVLTGLVLAIAVGAAIGTGVGAIAAIVLAATGTLDSFSDGAFFTLAGTLIGAAAGGAVGTAAAAFSAKATLLSQIGFGAFAGGTLGAIAGGSATLVNGDTDDFLLGVVIGGAIGAALGAVFGGLSLPAAVAGLEKGGLLVIGKLVGSLASTSLGIFSLSFNGTAELLDLEKRLPQQLFKASLVALGVGLAAPFIPAAAGGGEVAELATSLGAL